ncbi:MAG: HlyD family efflux transporter periplasmic adaptor subunit [Eggerthellaceae bacterium]|nr:HlyD family efflux transporter periplasmic adaptor subunit [Eggerthellaceae bacterium]
MKKLSGILAASLALSLALMTGCNGASGETASVQSVAMICGIGSTANVERFAGVVETKAETKIEKDKSFTVQEMLVEVGDAVAEGQVLFVYDLDRLTLELEKAELEIELQKATIEEKKASIKQLDAERDRVGASSKLGYTLQIQQLEVEITEGEFAITAAEKDLEQQKKLLDNLEVRSPVAGTVRSINLTDATDNYGNLLPFMVITEMGDYRVKGFVNEANRASLYEGMTVLVRSRVDDVVQRGVIKTIDLANPQSSGREVYYSDGGSDDTQTSSKYPFYVEMSSSEGFILGQHVYIEPDYGQGDEVGAAIMLPEYYISDADSNPWVWAESKSGKLEKRSLTLGAYDEMLGAWEVLEGLTPEDHIAFPEEGLKSGMACTEYDGYIEGGDMGFEDGGDYAVIDDGNYAVVPEAEPVPMPMPVPTVPGGAKVVG